MCNFCGALRKEEVVRLPVETGFHRQWKFIFNCFLLTFGITQTCHYILGLGLSQTTN